MHSCGLTDICVGQLSAIIYAWFGEKSIAISIHALVKSAIFVLSPWPDNDVFQSTHVLWRAMWLYRSLSHISIRADSIPLNAMLVNCNSKSY